MRSAGGHRSWSTVQLAGTGPTTRVPGPTRLLRPLLLLVRALQRLRSAAQALRQLVPPRRQLAALLVQPLYVGKPGRRAGRVGAGDGA